MSKASNIPQQPKVRSVVAIAMHQRGGKGSHGPAKRAARRQDRQASKRALRAEAC